MKTLVIGVFDNTEAAEEVLRQLAASPLDLRSVAVLHRDAGVQAALASAAGLPGDRSAGLLIAVGAVLGGAVGAWAGGPEGAAFLADTLGPVLSAASGAVIGAVGVFSAGVLAESLPVPKEQEATLAAAIEAGASAVIVQIDSVPTARAISDLFHSAGARDFGLGSSPAAEQRDVPQAEPANDLFLPPERRAGPG